jgi:hypothetical protein
MKPAPRPRRIVKVGDLLRERLRETKRTSRELAEAAEVPTEYVDELMSGRRRPPLPSRTDIYDKMSRFLGLGRGDLAECASVERAGMANGSRTNGGNWKLLLVSCEPATARELERRAKRGEAEALDLVERLLGIAQGSVRRSLDDQIALRVSAAQRGLTYVALRLRVLEFLDATLETLTEADIADFVRPRIERWDVDLETGVLRVVLRAQEAQDRDRRRPVLRSGTARRAS